VVTAICRQVQWNAFVGICEEIQLQQGLVAADRKCFTWITPDRRRVRAVFKFIVTVFLHSISICNWLVSKVLQFYAKLSCSDAIIKSQQIFTKLFHRPRWKFLGWRSERSAYSVEDFRSSHYLMLLRIVSTMRLYTTTRYSLTGPEANEISPMDIVNPTYICGVYVVI